MKSLAFHKEQGISIRRLNIILFTVSAVLCILLLLVLRKSSSLYREYSQLSDDIINLEKNATMLMEASDYLTEEIRSFAITGDRRHLNNYFEEANVIQRRERALQALKKNNEKTVAYVNLENAMQHSQDLMKTEYYSAKLAIEAYDYKLDSYPEVIRNTVIREQDEALSKEDKLKLAEEILFDDHYMHEKEQISNNINKCLEELAEELKLRKEDMDKRLKRQTVIEHILIMVLILIMFVIVFFTSHYIIIPLKKAVSRIRDERDVELSGAYEVRFLAKTYNLMYQTNLVNKEKLNYEATHDKLTGLYNRRGYDFLIKNLDIETSTLMIIDLDNFKSINDEYGHDVGDKVLTKAADVIYTSFRNQDYVCRIGGDEFAVIMVHSTSSLKELIERKVQLMNEKMSEGNDQIPACSFSVGVAFGESKQSVDQIFKNADNALYATKKDGRCGVNFSE
ncbi:MAG: GGDEF domain-containing protein [Lachnospiraceae bacterium]|nr:GGDEF domain-containing protein [Lachnospiraceae bacterium]